MGQNSGSSDPSKDPQGWSLNTSQAIAVGSAASALTAALPFHSLSAQSRHAEGGRVKLRLSRDRSPSESVLSFFTNYGTRILALTVY